MRKIQSFRYLPILFILLLCLQSCKDDPVSRVNSNQEFEELLTELEANLDPLLSTDPNSPTSDLNPLNSIADAQVIGLGEATHGTKEYFQMKHKIFRYLVENHNVRVFAFEADMGESIFINRYVQGGPGDIEEIMKTRMHFWTWRTEEVRDLLQWMRDYNEGKSESEKIHYIGVDTQYMTYQPQLIENYIKRTEPSLLEETRDVLKEFRDLEDGHPALNYQEITSMQFEVLSDTLQYLMDKIHEMKPNLISSSSNFDFQTHLQLIRNLQQVHEHHYTLEKYQNRTLRDKFMAENTRWISTLLGEKTKIAVWAHNGHIFKYEGRIGHFLGEVLNDDYKAIGFSFGTGSFRARGVNSSTEEISGVALQTIVSKPLSNSINAIFYEAEEEDFILNLEDLSLETKLGEYMMMENDFFSLGALYNNNPSYYYRPLSLKSRFDMIIHINQSNPTISLE